MCLWCLLLEVGREVPHENTENIAGISSYGKNDVYRLILSILVIQITCLMIVKIMIPMNILFMPFIKISITT